MNRMAITWISTILFPFLSFGADLEVHTDLTRIDLINQGAVSCQELVESKKAGRQARTDLPALHFAIPKLKLSWNHSENLNLNWMQMLIKDGDGVLQAQTQFVGSDLFYTWFAAAPGEHSAIVITPSAPKENACPFVVSGIMVDEPSSDRSGVVEIRVYGSYEKDGKAQGVEASLKLPYFYRGSVENQ